MWIQIRRRTTVTRSHSCCKSLLPYPCYNCWWQNNNRAIISSWLLFLFKCVCDIIRVCFTANQPHPPGAPPQAPGSLLAPSCFESVSGKPWCRSAVYFSLSIAESFTLPWCWYQRGVNVHGVFFLLVRAFVCIRVCVWVCVCVCFYAIQAPRSKGMALWWVYQTKNFMPISWVLTSSQLTSSFAPSAHHVHIYIGVWCRYRS